MTLLVSQLAKEKRPVFFLQVSFDLMEEFALRENLFKRKQVQIQVQYVFYSQKPALTHPSSPSKMTEIQPSSASN